MSENAARETIAVVGLGSIGGIIAATLCAAGRHDVIACVRKPIDRLTLERPSGAVEVAIRSLTDPAAAVPVEWVFLCTKVHHTASVVPWLAKLCDPANYLGEAGAMVDRVLAMRGK